MQRVYSISELRDTRSFKRFRRIIWTLMGLPFLLFSKRGRDFDLNHYSHTLPQLKSPIKLMQLSDLHYGLYVSKKNVLRWFDAAVQEASQATIDVIVLTGDFFDYLLLEDTDFLLEQMARLSAPLGVYAVWGNHDYDKGSAYLKDFEQKLTAKGVKVLNNKGCYLRKDFFLAGVDDAREGNPDLAKALLDYGSDACCVLLSHVPDLIPLLPKEVALTLCGHTHGGQIILPYLGVRATSSFYGKRFASGWVSEPSLAYISKGLGYTSIPIRLNCRAEITLIDLLPEGRRKAI